MSPAGHGSEPVTAAASETAPANPRDPRSHPNHPAPPAGFGTKICPATSGVPVVGTPQVSPRHTGDPSLRPPCPHGAGDGSDAAPLPRRHAAGGFPAHLHRVHADLAALPGPAAPVSFCCGNWGKLGSIPRWGRAQPPVTSGGAPNPLLGLLGASPSPRGDIPGGRCPSPRFTGALDWSQFPRGAAGGLGAGQGHLFPAEAAENPAAREPVGAALRAAAAGRPQHHGAAAGTGGVTPGHRGDRRGRPRAHPRAPCPPRTWRTWRAGTPGWAGWARSRARSGGGPERESPGVPRCPLMPPRVPASLPPRARRAALPWGGDFGASLGPPCPRYGSSRPWGGCHTQPGGARRWPESRGWPVPVLSPVGTAAPPSPFPSRRLENGDGSVSPQPKVGTP